MELVSFKCYKVSNAKLRTSLCKRLKTRRPNKNASDMYFEGTGLNSRPE